MTAPQKIILNELLRLGYLSIWYNPELAINLWRSQLIVTLKWPPTKDKLVNHSQGGIILPLDLSICPSVSGCPTLYSSLPIASVCFWLFRLEGFHSGRFIGKQELVFHERVINVKNWVIGEARSLTKLTIELICMLTRPRLDKWQRGQQTQIKM